MDRPIITVYGRHDCPLCDDALDMVKSLRREYDFHLEEVNITADEEIFRRYKETIPVIAVNGRVRLMALFSEEDLRRVFRMNGIAPVHKEST